MEERIIYLNGQFLPISQAHVSVMDRGFLFGDGVYEVIPAYNGHFFRLREHLNRLQKSLDAIQLPMQIDYEDWYSILTKLLKLNTQNSSNYSIYLQITRGITSNRAHVMDEPIKPTLFAQCSTFKLPDLKDLAAGYLAITAEDIRWHRCNIKSLNLLANILLAQQAKAAGAREAILLRDGFLTEGTMSNVFVVKDHVIKTPPQSNIILGGITRDLILELIRQNHLPYEETAISESELRKADEIWITSSSKEIMPITQLDHKPVGNGKTGEAWRHMIKIYRDFRESIV